MGSGWSGSKLVQGDGKGDVEFPSHEGEGCCIQETGSGLNEGPTNDGVNSYILSQSNVDVEGAITREEVGHVVGNHSLKEARLDSLGNLRGVRLGDCSSEADGIKWLLRVIKLNGTGHTVRVLDSKSFVEGAEATVEAGTGIQ